MRIAVFGLGYVGTVSAACLAQDGHVVVGVDPALSKVDLINAGKTPIIERGVGEIIEEAVRNHRLRATPDVADAIRSSELSFVCVGTPSQPNGSLDLRFVRKACEEIGTALAASSASHVVVIRSTMLPGSMRDVVIPTLEASSGRKAGQDFGVCINPEFLREGSAIHDFRHPPKTVIGEVDTQSGDRLATLYAGLGSEPIRTTIETAEMVKYTDNVWHALKVGFANEIGNVCKGLGIDGHRVMDIFCTDTKLNLSAYYLKPGFAFGGSCLPKDVRALSYKAKSIDVDVPIVNSIMPSNMLQIERGLRMIMEQEHRRIGVLGFSFKAGTDDLRESPMVEVIERLIGKGYDLRLYDRNVRLASLVGANRDYILNRIPHISRLIVEHIEDILGFAETIVVGNGDAEFRDVVDRLRGDQVLVDLVRVSSRGSSGNYRGICW